MVDDPLKQLGEIFKKARLRSGLTLEDLAEKARIPERHIDSIEKGKRDQLPEEAFLLGFLNKLAKVLKLKDPKATINAYKAEEGQFIVQNILNENHMRDESKPLISSFLKIYHLYILIALVFVFGVFYLIGSHSNTDTGFKNQANGELSTFAPGQVQTTSKKQALENPVSVFGKGAKSLRLDIEEVAWFHVYGIAAAETLYEGEVYPNLKPNKFEFKDDIGFVLSSANAGAFKVYDSKKTFILGKSGKLVKWYYPEGAKYEYEQRNKH